MSQTDSSPSSLSRIKRTTETAWSMLRAGSFWMAAILPIVYLPASLVSEISPGWFFGAIALNVCCLVVGRGYRQGS